jgi:hypothetical protein
VNQTTTTGTTTTKSKTKTSMKNMNLSNSTSTSTSSSGAGTCQGRDIAMEHPQCNIEVKLGTDDSTHKNQEAPPLAKTNMVLSRSRTDTTAITMTNSQDNYDLGMMCRTGSSTASSSSSSCSSSRYSGGEMIEPVEEQQFSQPSFDIEVELGMLQLPGRPPVSNECAICLEGYRLGDPVICSTNSACQHVFHQDCIVFHCMAYEQKRASRPFSYRHGTFRQQQLQQQQHQRDNANKRETVPCPICRQAFDDIPATLCSTVSDNGSTTRS